MQVNNPDFFPTPGAGPTAVPEKPGDGLFDTLLRAEEARYEDAPPPRPERGNDYRADDYYRDLDREAPPHEQPGDPEDHPNSNNASAAAGNERPSDDDVTSEDSAQAAVDEQSEESQEVPPENAASPAQAGSNEEPGSQQASVENDQTKASTPAPGTAAENTAATGLVTPITAGNQTATGGAATGAPAGNEGSKAVASTAASAPATVQAAAAAQNSAASGKPAAKESTAEKKAPEAVAKPDSAKAANATAGQAAKAPADAARANAPAEDVSVTVTNAGLASRPSASLGGAAATAALATEAEPTTPPPNSGDQAKKKTGQPGAAVIGGQKAAMEQNAKATQSADTSAPGATHNSDKGAGEVRTAGPLGSGLPGTANPGGQVSSPTAGVTTTSGTLQNASFAETLTSARGGAASAPAEQVALQIQKANVAGKDQISIKLHPAELGRIEVKMENGNDGVLRAVISAERSETLDLLQRDARGLERALQDAGVKTDSGSLSFNLKGQQQQADQSGSEDQAAAAPDDTPSTLEDMTAAPPPAALSGHDGALDIRV